MCAQTFQSYDNIYTPVKLFWKTGKPRPLAQPSAVAANPITLSLQLLLSRNVLCASEATQSFQELNRVCGWCGVCRERAVDV